MRRELLLFFTALTLFWGACGKKNNPTVVITSSNLESSETFNTVGDEELQQQAVILELESAVSAVSDGGSGSEGSGSSAADLLNLENEDALVAFAETRKCVASTISSASTLKGGDASSWQLPVGTPFLTITRTYSGTQGAKTFASNANGSASSDVETWYPGPYFGMANITADSGKNYGTVPIPTSGNLIPAIPSPSPTAAKGSSGVLGSVGWRSTDGSWTGAPLWEVGAGYISLRGGVAASASLTKGMVMYYTSNMPIVTAATSTPTIGGTYSATEMFPSGSIHSSNQYSVLGLAANGVLPSFTSSGMANVSSVETPINQAGTITTAGLPARIVNPPVSLKCAADGKNALPGWMFSQNVAGLTRMIKTNTSATRTYKKGIAASAFSGTKLATWSDPALVAPFIPATGKTSAPYVDQNAGTISLTRSISIGSSTNPNEVTSTLTPTGMAAKPNLTHSTYTSSPLVETTTHDLLNSWRWVTKRISSGTIISASSTGSEMIPSATISTTFKNVVWEYNVVQAIACVPKSGTITTTITPTETTQQTTTYTLKFGTSIGISTAVDGVTVMVACSAGSAGTTNCTAAAETNDSSYKPTGCNF